MRHLSVGDRFPAAVSLVRGERQAEAPAPQNPDVGRYSSATSSCRRQPSVNDSQGSTDGGLRDQAVAAVKRKHAFKQMLASYVIVNAFLIVIWAVSGAGYFWPVWVLGGWGLGVAFTAYKAYGPREAITDDEVAHEMTRLRGT